MVDFITDHQAIKHYLDTQVTVVGTYTIQPNGIVDVDGHVKQHVYDIYQLKVKLGTVTGDVILNRIHLTSLKGFPHTVGGNVSVARTPVRSLKGAPTRVDGNFWAYGCKDLKSLKGAPHHVGKSFYAHQCRLNSLEGAPDHVGGVFDVTQNQLTSYDSVPQGSTQVNLPYNENAPVLKLLNYPLVHFTVDGVTRDLNKVRTINAIMHKYAGKGKSGMLNCALALKKAGLEGNAKW